MIKNLQCLRGVAALLVLIFHVVDIGGNFGGQHSILKVVMFGQSGVDLFFVISGFIIYYISAGKFKDRNNQKRFIIKRFFRIYPVYWFYTILLLLSLYSVNSIRLQHIELNYVLKSFLLAPLAGMPLLTVGWTLIYEVLFYTLFYILLFFSEKSSIVILSSWCILIGCSTLININSIYIQTILSPFNLEFILGCSIAYIYNNSKIHLSGKITTVFGVISIIIGSILYYNIRQDTPDGFIRVLLFGIPATIIVYGSIALEREKCYYNSILFHIGNASYSIYLSHTVVIWTLATIFNFFLKQNYSNYMTVMIIFCFISIGLGMLSYIIVEKPIIKIGRNLAQKISEPNRIKRTLTSPLS